MTYKVVSFEEKEEKSYLWGTFKYDKEKFFLFVSYLLGISDISNFYIIEEETGKAVKLSSFAARYGITKDDIKKR